MCLEFETQTLCFLLSMYSSIRRLTCLGLNSNPCGFGGSTLPSILCEESCLLISWCAGDRCYMVGSDEDRGGSMRPGVEDRGWSNTGQILGGRTIKRSDDAMCDLHRTQRDDEHKFLG
jgi:hypothetical protein